jgi:hypothetical protein
MSRTYKCTNGNNKRINKDHRYSLFYKWYCDIRNEEVDYNDGSDKEKALKLRSGDRYYGHSKHNKYARKHYRKQEKSDYKKNLNKGLNYNNWDELYLISTNKEVCRYT